MYKRKGVSSILFYIKVNRKISIFLDVLIFEMIINAIVLRNVVNKRTRFHLPSNNWTLPTIAPLSKQA